MSSHHSLIPIAVALGDGIGPEIMESTLSILKATKAPLEIKEIEVGEKVYNKGHLSGIEPATWDIIRSSQALLKAPITTPQGGGFKSLNVMIRASLGLYANIRPCVAYSPFIFTKHPKMDVVIVRENEEDLYMGIEYRQTQETYHALKVMTRPGCERIIRYAFEYARIHQRKKVTCFTKDNILKLSDGLFHHVFNDIASDYKDIENEHWIIDIGAAKLADTPQAFDVIVMPNLYGDILSDVAAQIAGSVGMAASSNIGVYGAMFEAIHGSAPRRAGQDMANPSGLILAAVQMLVYINLPTIAELIHNAWLKTIEDGIHTYDIYNDLNSTKKVGTKEFTRAIIERLGQNPTILSSIKYPCSHHIQHVVDADRPIEKKELVGIDIFIESTKPVNELHEQLKHVIPPGVTLTAINNRGVKVWPSKMAETVCSDSWRCRFMPLNKETTMTHHQIILLLKKLEQHGFDFTHTENLYTFNGTAGFT